MTDRIAEIEERLKIAMPSPWLRESSKPHSIFAADGEFVCGVVRNCDHDSLPLIQNAPTDIAYLLAALKSKDAECDRLREMLLKCEPALFALITLYPDREGEVCKEIRGIRNSVLAELEGR